MEGEAFNLHKNDLGLGNRLAHRFTEVRLPEYRPEVHEIFGHRGAYGKFKALLVRLRLLDAWFEFERAETELALREWARGEGMLVDLRYPNAGA